MPRQQRDLPAHDAELGPSAAALRRRQLSLEDFGRRAAQIEFNVPARFDFEHKPYVRAVAIETPFQHGKDVAQLPCGHAARAGRKRRNRTLRSLFFTRVKMK